MRGRGVQGPAATGRWAGNGFFKTRCRPQLGAPVDLASSKAAKWHARSQLVLLRLGSRGHGGVAPQQAGVLMHAWLLPSGSGKTGARALLQDESCDCNGHGTCVGGVCNCEMGWDPAANCSVPELCTDFGGAWLQALNPTSFPEPRPPWRQPRGK